MDIIFIPDGTNSIRFPVGIELFKSNPTLSFVVMLELVFLLFVTFLSSLVFPNVALFIWSTIGATPIPARLTLTSEFISKDCFSLALMELGLRIPWDGNLNFSFLIFFDARLRNCANSSAFIISRFSFLLFATDLLFEDK